MLERMEIWRYHFILIPNTQYKKDIITGKKKVCIYKVIPASKIGKNMSIFSNFLSKSALFFYILSPLILVLNCIFSNFTTLASF